MNCASATARHNEHVTLGFVDVVHEGMFHRTCSHHVSKSLSELAQDSDDAFMLYRNRCKRCSPFRTTPLASKPFSRRRFTYVAARVCEASIALRVRTHAISAGHQRAADGTRSWIESFTNLFSRSSFSIDTDRPAIRSTERTGWKSQTCKSVMVSRLFRLLAIAHWTA